jgi:hypothetical protein
MWCLEGGVSIVARDIFSRLSPERNLYLYDTFAGMTQPTEADIDLIGRSANAWFSINKVSEEKNNWAYASLDHVKFNFQARKLLSDQVHFIKGDVMTTLQNPDCLPEKISVLRIDTDWYDSIKVCLEYLYPRLSVGGCILIDDYGHWQGAKKAVDEYFADKQILLWVTDYTGRMGVKVS